MPQLKKRYVLTVAQRWSIIGPGADTRCIFLIRHDFLEDSGRGGQEARHSNYQCTCMCLWFSREHLFVGVINMGNSFKHENALRKCLSDSWQLKTFSPFFNAAHRRRSSTEGLLQTDVSTESSLLAPMGAVRCPDRS